MKQFLVIGQQIIDSCVNIVILSYLNFLSKLSDMIKIHLFWHSLTLSSYHILLLFSKL